jgi:hypothetical protein
VRELSGLSDLNCAITLVSRSKLIDPVIASQRVSVNGSRECAPDDRLREAIGRADFFAATLVAMTAKC